MHNAKKKKKMVINTITWVFLRIKPGQAGGAQHTCTTDPGGLLSPSHSLRKCREKVIKEKRYKQKQVHSRKYLF